MTSSEFKKAWRPDDLNQWTEFDPQELSKTDLSELTKSFLSSGFPEDAAPFLSFGLRSFDWKFYNMNTFHHYSHHDLGTAGSQYWIFGSDSGGNPICLNSGNQDAVVLLNHERGFKPIEIINRNVIELAHCLLEFKKFINQINEEFGEDGFFDSLFGSQHIIELEMRFKHINIDIFSESGFWKTEVQNLYSEIE